VGHGGVHGWRIPGVDSGERSTWATIGVPWPRLQWKGSSCDCHPHNSMANPFGCRLASETHLHALTGSDKIIDVTYGVFLNPVKIDTPEQLSSPSVHDQSSRPDAL
jgi:hypothetical protein